jgi:Flp pilus assembly protein TadD
MPTGSTRHSPLIAARSRSSRAPESWSGLGTVLYFEGRYEEARAAFEKGVLLKPGQPMMWGNLAAACSRIPGQEPRGREALARAVALTLDRLALNPNDCRGLGMARDLAGELGERTTAWMRWIAR